MTLLLGILAAVGGLLVAFVGATAFSLGSSDAAGNGLAEVYLASSVIGLWLLIGLMLLLGANTPPRQALNWGAIDVASLLLFAVAVGGQIGALQALSERRVEGVYRALLLVAVTATPIAALAHIAWRGLGAPLPYTIAVPTAAVVVAASSLPLWRFLQPARAVRTPRVDPLDALEYPALLLPSLATVLQVESSSDLRVSHGDEIASAQGDTFLVDSSFQIFVLRDVRRTSAASGPQTRSQELAPVSFRLVDWSPDGTADAARAILLRVRRPGVSQDGNARLRELLATETTLEGMARAIRLQ